VCDVFSRARRFQTAAAGWLTYMVDERCCVRLLRAALAAGLNPRSTSASANNNRWMITPTLPRARHWMPPLYHHDNRLTATSVMNELPRPFLDFTKMQVYRPIPMDRRVIVLSRAYLRNGRAYGTSCRLSVCPSVCLTVTDVLWLSGKS